MRPEYDDLPQLGSAAASVFLTALHRVPAAKLKTMILISARPSSAAGAAGI